LAEQTGISEWLQFDCSIVRGLSYYTGMVFEGFFKNTAVKRSVCGGGRYDNLLETYGAESEPAIGFGFGDVVIIECLRELALLPDFELGYDYVIIPYNDTLYAASVNVANLIRKKDKRVSIYMDGGGIKKGFNYCDKTNTPVAILIAPTEWKNNLIVVKYMRETNENKKQLVIGLSDYLDII